MANIDARVLADSLRGLGNVGDGDIAAAVGGVVQAVTGLFRVTGAGLMIVDEQRDLRYVAASNAISKVVEEEQSRAGEGPCVTAFLYDRVVHVDDLRADSRWPRVRGIFLRHGVAAVLGVPVHLGGVPVGTLDVFADRPHSWDDTETAALRRYGELVEAVLSTALAAHRAGELAAQLQYALDYRIVIERAVGYLMARRGTGPEDAFNELRGAARARRRKVAEVAQYLLDTGSLAGPG
jgi:GAF domain-containing protein